MHIPKRLIVGAILLSMLSGCASYLGGQGPRAEDVVQAPSNASLPGIELVKVNYALADGLQKEAQRTSFSSVFEGSAHADYVIGKGDTLQVYIWEAPPAMLFTSSALSASGLSGGGGAVTLPPQIVSNSGDISVPFAGTLHVLGLTIPQLEDRIRQRLERKANHPQVLVQLVHNNTQNITVVGNVQRSLEVPMLPGGVRLLRAVALAGGVTKPVEKTTIQVSRKGRVMALPLQSILKNPADNIELQPGDVVTALYQPMSFTALGAVAKTGEVDFEANGISMAQALARVGGLNDNQSNPSAVFLFRFMPPNALSWPKPPKQLVDGKVPTIFEFDLRDPATLFAAQSFPIENHDLLYVSNAPAADLQKVLGLVGSIVYPFQSLNALGVIR